MYATVVVANSQGAGCSGCRLGRLARYAKIVARSTVPSTKGQGHDAGICQELAEALSPLQSLFNQHNDAGWIPANLPQKLGESAPVLSFHDPTEERHFARTRKMNCRVASSVTLWP